MDKKRLEKLAYITSAVVFIAVGVWGQLLSPGDEIGYVVFGLSVLLPVVSFIMSFLLAKVGSTTKYVYPVVFGILGIIIPYIVFNNLDLIAVVYSLVPSLLGLGLGRLIGNRSK